MIAAQEARTALQALDSRPRRRRREPSTDSEGRRTSDEQDFGYTTHNRQEDVDLVDPSKPGRHEDTRSAPKRRRLMTQNMRQEFPINANGTQSYTNGSTQSPQKNGYHEQTNGHEQGINGVNHANTNGYSIARSKARFRNYFGHDREEVTRLLMQGLEDLGYTEAANQLSRESGFQVESPSIATFRHALLDGEWLEAETILFGEAFDPEEGGVSLNGKTSNRQTGLELVENADPSQLKFLIREQKYIELLRNNRRGEALTVLQSELQPLKHDNHRLNMLSGYVKSFR